jgi:hypothetical protein
VSGGEAPSVSLTINVHVHPDTAITSRLLMIKDRGTPIVTLTGGGCGGQADVTVFAERPDLLRLREAVDRVLADLDATEDRSGA